MNILYLVQQGLLDLPILYLSRYIIQNKEAYYDLLQIVRDEQNWEDWLLYMIEAIADTASKTVALVQGIDQLRKDFKKTVKSQNPQIYSHELMNNLFKHPYTKIAFVQSDLSVSRPSATKYLNLCGEMGLVRKVKVGKTNYYINTQLVDLLVSHS